ncbi:hypothetical protein BBJ28_00002510 [Nothophytophthora sp. Chile5]|nr:hypothetical protein BBJ28_00002510 [Nothophytophthora sp. Chile5]
MEEPRFRRLIKFQARRREGLGGSELEILTETVSAFIREDPRLAFTVYRMRIRSPEDVLHHTGLARDRAADAGGRWVLEKRYSEFDFFRKQHLKHIEQWESVVRREFARSEDTPNIKSRGDTRKTFALVSNALRRAISPSFPKKRLRVDTPKIIAERIEGLTEFVRTLMSVYNDLSIYMTNSQLQSSTFASSSVLLHSLLKELEAFLEVPQPQKDAEWRRQSAVLALEDLEDLPELEGGTNGEGGFSEPMCCICLNEEDPAAENETPLVRLPCHHHFHEDCVIDWFSASTTCPLCRRSTASPTA